MQSEKIIEAMPADRDLAQRRRVQIAHAALAAFARKGFHETRVSDVAREAGLAVGTIHEYVETKEDLLYLASQQAVAKLKERVSEVVSRHRSLGKVEGRHPGPFPGHRRVRQ